MLTPYSRLSLFKNRTFAYYRFLNISLTRLKLNSRRR